LPVVKLKIGPERGCENRSEGRRFVGKRSSLVFDMMPSRSDFEVHPVNPVILSKGYLRGFFASAVICVYQLAQLNFYPVEFENYSTGAALRTPFGDSTGASLLSRSTLQQSLRATCFAASISLALHKSLDLHVFFRNPQDGVNLCCTFPRHLSRRPTGGINRLAAIFHGGSF
jgi:hypothetical protein